MRGLIAREAERHQTSQSLLCVFLGAFLCALCGSNFLFAQSQEFSLNSSEKISWQFRKSGDSKWYNATVPGCVHTDLLANKLIPDPFYRDNESKVQWVENEDWEYETIFNCDPQVLANKRLELHFDGLDTYADVFLNDSLILQSSNMFRLWNVDVKKFLREKNNRLFIHFYSAVKKGKELAAQLNYKLPVDEGGKAFERKSKYQFGWDWGPRLVTCGVWKDAKLFAWNKFKIEEPQITTAVFKDTTEIIFTTAIISDTSEFRRFGIQANYYDGSLITQQLFSLREGNNKVSLDIKMPYPIIWSINDFGYLYRYDLNLFENGVDSILFLKDFQFGVHTLQLIQQPDSFGSSFYFQLNGQPLFIKGANIIPPDNFLSRVTDEDYKRLVDDAVAAHMNMLRVWGGGAYLPDAFYDYCDEKGILIWQDFMFANAMVPGDSAFVENVKQEAIDQVIRLRNHPCIALWCGNNEISEAWNNWEFQDENKGKPDVNEKIWNDYKRIFDTILPQIVHEYDPGRSYIESSPKFGWGHKESLQQGDSHYWGVWWGSAPFSSYENHVGRFMSEYGFQSLPSMDCFYEFATPDDWKQVPVDKKSASNVLNVHEKHERGYELIHDYMKQDYNVPHDFEKYAYVSQLVQRNGVGEAIEAHRRAKPYCMGTMYWQLNDCWPVISWSSIDYTGQWKALHYALRDDLYKTFLISVKQVGNKYMAYLVSDSLSDIDATLKVKVLKFTGDTSFAINIGTHLKSNSSQEIWSYIPSDEILHNSSQSMIRMELYDGDKLLAEKNFFFEKPQDLSLPNPNLKTEIHYSRMKSPYEDYPNVYTVTLHADAFAKDVFLSYDFEEVKFSDNFFDMLPGEERNIIMYSKEAIDETHMPVKIISLYDAK